MKTFLFLLFWLFPVVVLAAPTITGISGTVSARGSLTISGSSFGNGPIVELFDDFEDGTNGVNIPVGAGVVGDWDSFGDNNPYYTNAASVSGNMSFRTDNASSWLTYGQVDLGFETEIFVSWWMFIPSGTNIPGEGNADGMNWKVTWVQGESPIDDDHTLPTIMDTSVKIGSNDRAYNTWITFPFVKGKWLRVSVWIDAGTPGSANGSLRFVTFDSGGSVVRDEVSNTQILKAGGAYEKVRFNGYGRMTANCFPTFDDVYAARGPNAQARIEIGNAPTYAASTKLAIMPTTAWSNNSISVVGNVAGFSDGENAYVFVIDSNNVASAGYPVVVNAPSTGITCYKDADGDLYSDATSEVVTSCSPGYYENNALITTYGDCNDNDTTIHPGAIDICGDGIDQDCVGGDASCAPTTTRCATPVSIQGVGR